MMLVFFFGMGASALLAATTQSAWQLAAALTLLGAFASIYHPVGIPMLVRDSLRPGLTIGVNGLAGNLGVALSAVVTGLLVKYVGWRAAFVVPALIAIACGIRVRAHRAGRARRRRRGARTRVARALEASFARVFAVMTVASVDREPAVQLHDQRQRRAAARALRGHRRGPGNARPLLALVYVIGSFAQVAVGLMIDRVPLKYLYAAIVALQVPLFALAASAQGWALYALMIAFMVVVFGAIPFTDAMIVRYVDDRMRSRVSGMRLTVAFGVSSLAVWLLGPVVKAAGFRTLLLAMAAIAARDVPRSAVAAATRSAGDLQSSRRRTRHHDRLAQRIEEARRRGDHLVGAQVLAAAGEIPDAAARLADEQAARGDVPRLEAHHPEAVESSRRDVREVKCAGARAPDARALTGECVEHREVAGQLRAASRRKHRAHERVGQARARGHMDLRAVALRALALDRREELVVHRVEHHCMRDVVVLCASAIEIA